MLRSNDFAASQHRVKEVRRKACSSRNSRFIHMAIFHNFIDAGTENLLRNFPLTAQSVTPPLLKNLVYV